MRAFTLVCLLSAAAVPAADNRFTGYARDLETGALLYLEEHAVTDSGTAEETREVLYRRDQRSPPFARKALRYGADRERPSFDFVDQRSGFAESVTRAGEGFKIWTRAGATSRERTAVLPAADVAVIDAGFDEFVRSHWAALQAGRSLDAPFLIPSRLEAVNFRLRRISGGEIGGAEVSVIRISLSGPLGWFLPDIEVSYRDADRRLMRYRGLTNIRDEQGDLLSAQIDFPGGEPTAQ